MKLKVSFLMFFFSLICFNAVFSQDTFNNLPNEDLGNASDEFQEAFFEALKEKANGNHEKAIDFLKKCQEINESQSVVYFELGKNFKALKDYELAEDYLKAALKIEKTNEWYLDELYDVYLKMKSTEQAIKVLKELLPFHNDYKEDLVDLYIDAKKYSNALNLLNELDESSNFSIEREKTRFKIYNLSNDFRAKESYLIEQIQKYPKKESYYLKLIVFYSEQNDLENALIISENLLQVLPNSDRVHLSLYKFNLQQTKIDAAVESLLIVCNSPLIPAKSKTKTLNDFKKFVKANPSYESLLADVLNQLENTKPEQSNKAKAEALLKSKKYKLALSYFEKAIQSEPNNFYLYKQVALLSLQEKIYERALEYSSQGMKLFPVQPLFYLINGTSNNLINNPNKAIDSLELGIDFVINDNQLKYDFYLQLSESYKLLGKTKQYNEYFNKAEVLRQKQ